MCNLRTVVALTPRSQIIEYLRETFYRHALEGYLEPARPEKNKNKLFLAAETPDNYWSFRRPAVGGETFSPPPPVLGPEQKNWLYHPLLLFMAVTMIINMWHSSGYRMPHSWLTQVAAFSVNQPVLVPKSKQLLSSLAGTPDRTLTHVAQQHSFNDRQAAFSIRHNERVWCITQLEKLSFNYSIGRTHSWRFSTFYFSTFYVKSWKTSAVSTTVEWLNSTLQAAWYIIHVCIILRSMFFCELNLRYDY